MAGLAPPNLRVTNDDGPEVANDLAAEGITVEMADEAPDSPDTDDKGNIVRIEHGDGSVTVSLDGTPLADNPNAPKKDTGWFANLVEEIDDSERGRISEELLRGISDDLQSRQEWIEARATGIQLLGLKIEVPGLQGASDGAPVEGMSKVRHPLLLEAVLRFQANARSELLPTDGPVKVRDDSNGSDSQKDMLADALEQDLNHYLTAVASEYYPDTDRMLLMLGFGGTSFKKVNFCPLRMRPVSETVDSPDLIVNNAATDLQNAKRITHRVMLRPSTVKRLQILGVYRDISLSTPVPSTLDAAQRAEKDQQGVSPDSMNPEDRDREIYECYCELEIKGFEHQHKGEPSGLEIPYRVTMDVSSREILSIVRNYDKKTEALPKPRVTFVKYTFVPGLGFYDIGLLHILGNTTNAITAAWREMLDNGMFANFPGFLLSDTGARQNTNIFRVPPGGAALVKTGGQKMSDAVMALPYTTQQMPALMALVQDMATTGMRIGGTSEAQVGEGRADAPVGTTLALIDQATKVLNSVHKRMHASQAAEFKLLVECFREHPESFWESDCPSKTAWDEQTFIHALDSCDLVPQADPNTASHGQRVMKIQALKMLQSQSPNLYNPIAVDTVALQAIGWSNPQQFLAPPAAQAAPPPELQEIQAGIATAKQTADAKTTEANAKAAKAQAEVAEIKARVAQGGLGAAKPEPPNPLDTVRAKAAAQDSQTKQSGLSLQQQELELKKSQLAADNHNQELDRQAEAHSDAIDLAKTIMGHEADARAAAAEVQPIEKEIGA